MAEAADLHDEPADDVGDGGDDRAAGPASKRRKLQQRICVTLASTGETQTIVRNADGAFHCPLGCENYHATNALTMRSHLRRMHDRVGDDNDDEDEAAGTRILRGDGSELFRDATLDALNLALNVARALLLCTQCGWAVGVSWSEHSQKHGTPVTQDEQAHVDGLRTTYGVGDGVPELLPGRAVQGLRLKQGHHCSACDLVTGSKEVMRKHGSAHAGMTVAWQPVFLQQTWMRSKLVVVEAPAEPPPPPPPPPPRVPADEAAAQFASLMTAAPTPPQVHAPGGERDSTGFHRLAWGAQTVTAMRTVTAIRGLVGPSVPTIEEGVIIAVVKKFFLDTSTEVRLNAQRLFQELVKLQSFEDAEQYKPFSVLQESSQATYVETTARLVLLLVRNHAKPVAGCEIPVELGVRTAVERLVREPTATAVYELLLALLAPATTADTHVMAWYLRLRSVRIDGAMAGPGEVRHWAVHLLYACRLAVAHSICSRQTLPSNDDAIWQLVQFPGHSPFSTIQSLSLLARKCHEHEPKEAVLEYVTESDGRAVRLLDDDVVVTVEQIGTCVAALKATIARDLGALTQGLPLVAATQVEGTRGHADRQAAGYSEVPDCADRLRRAMFANADIRAQFTNDYDAAAKKFLARAQDLLDRLLVLVHLLSGLPARGTEIGTYRLTNGEDTEHPRSVRISHGVVMLRQIYTKTEGLLGQGHADICRFLDAEASTLLLSYLAMVRPIEVGLVANLYGKTERAADAEARVLTQRSYLFVSEGSRYSDDRIGRVFRNICHGLGLRVGLAIYRHVARAFTVRLLKLDLRVRGLMAAFDLQSAHGEQTAMLSYARTPDQVASIEAVEEYYLVSREWQATITSAAAVPPRHPVRLPAQPPALVPPVQRAEIVLNSRPQTASAAHAVGPALARVPSAADARRVLACLRAYYGPDAEPRNDAAGGAILRALTTVLDADHDILVVAPTGSGKTLLALGPILVEDPGLVTVVLIPFKALARQYEELCQARNISAVWWDPRQDPAQVSARVLLVSGENAWHHELVRLLHRLYIANRLRRIVIDEVHVYLTSDSYRPMLRRALTLRQWPVPVVCLSGTIPPAFEVDVQMALAAPDMAVVRVPSVRNNLRLSVMYVARPEDVAGAVVEAALGDYSRRSRAGHGRVLVMCMSKSETDAIAQLLIPIAAVYHADMLDDDQLEAVSQWRSGEKSIMVATSGFGTGVDYPSVRLVVHVGGSYDTLALAQANGRAGRDGKYAENLVVVARNGRPDEKPYSVRRWLESNDECRVQRLAVDIDGAACLPCVLAKRPPCDVCARVGTASEPDPVETAALQAAAAARKRVVDEACDLVDKVRLRLDSPTCYLCMMKGQFSGTHAHSACPTIKWTCYGCLQHGHDRLHCTNDMAKLSFKNVCFKCGLPDAVASKKRLHAGTGTKLRGLRCTRAS